MKKLIAILILAAPLLGQTITPVISEYGKGKANGQFTVRNDSLKPQSVTVEPLSFSVDTGGQAHFRPLDTTTHVQLAGMSASVGAGQQHAFSYSIRCDVLPCSVAFLASVSGPHLPNGLALRLVLSHVVYVCEKQKGCRASVLPANLRARR